METDFRQARPEELDEIMAIIGDAQAFMKTQGLDQWQNGYPDAATLAKDIENGNSYLLLANGVPAGTAAIIFGDEPDYATIHGSPWGSSGAYAVVHRVALHSRYRGGGLGAAFMGYIQQCCRAAGMPAIRIDTHPQNLPMQRFLEKGGFTRRGTLYISSGSEAGAERVGFDLLL